MFHMNLDQISEFDWLSGQLKAYFYKIFKHLLKTHKVDEAKVFHT